MPDDWRPGETAPTDYAVAVLLAREDLRVWSVGVMVCFVANAASEEEAKGIAVSAALAGKRGFAVREVVAARRPPPPES